MNLQRAELSEDVTVEADALRAGRDRRGRHRRRGACGAIEAEHVDAALEVGDVDVALVPVRSPGVAVAVDEPADLANVGWVRGVEEAHALRVEAVGRDAVAARAEVMRRRAARAARLLLRGPRVERAHAVVG